MITIPPTRLGAYLFAMGIPQEDIANEIGISAQYMNQLVWGKRRGRKNFEKIAEFLEIPLEIIWEGEKKPGRPRRRRM